MFGSVTSDQTASDTQPNILQITQCLAELISDVEKAKGLSGLQLEALGLQLKRANLELEKSLDALNSKSDELQKLRLDYEQAQTDKRLLQKELDDFRTKDKVQCSELKNTKSNFDSMLLHLHQLQEELDHYYRLSRKQCEMLTDGNKLNKRIIGLISEINS